MYKPITEEMFQTHRAALGGLSQEIIDKKRHVYTQGNADILHNFRLSSQMANTTVGQQIATHMIKQFVSVVNLMTRPDIIDSEKDTRFADLRNYLDIAYVAYKEGAVHENTL